ncbi:LysR family transcriptional regulator [Neisseriaceae bacterium JH1-16]|nr:LysR family transcriptional regulator [Neisseriaceae bacterium JH1-16]
MDTIRAMHSLVRAVELGSLSAAARELGSTQPTVSKTIAALEQQLGARLLIRTTSNVAPTEQGRRFYERAKRMLEEYGEAVADVRGLIEQPVGPLRVSAPVSLGVLCVNALVLEFLAQYPEIEIELLLNDRFIDLTEEGVDVALRLGEEMPPNAVARRLARSPRYLVASPDYLRAHPLIERPEDLVGHSLLRFAGAASIDAVELFGPQGQLAKVPVQGRYRVNSALAIREALLGGVGPALAPTWLAGDLLGSGQLLRVLPDWQSAMQSVSVLYPPRRYQALRARVFIQFLAERVPLLPGFEPLGSASPT